jgi:UDP-N-acetyl-2-amino-2-deoxyglucuronate dehydrogenase
VNASAARRREESEAHVTVGLIGSGNISRTHARAAEAAGLAVGAVLGRTLEGATRLAGDHGATPYADAPSFFAHPGLDFVIIGTPSGQHADHGCEAARRGLPVLVEKPIDVTVERADALIDAAAAARVPLAVCFQERFAPDLCAVKDMIARGALGRLLVIDARVPWYRPPTYYTSAAWRGTWARDGGGALMNQGIHTVDLLLWLAGDVAQVRGRVDTVRHTIEVEDTASALFEFACGAHGTLTATTAMYPGYPRRILIAGTAGTITIERDSVIAADLDAGRPEGLTVRPPAIDDGRASTPIVSDVSGHRAVIEDFVRAIQSGACPRCDGIDGRRSVAVVRAVYDASASGAPVVPAGRVA